MVFSYFNSNEGGFDMESLPASILKFFIIMSLPVFSLFQLKRNFEKLDDPDFNKKFGTLFQNLYVKKSSATVMTTLFCTKRIILALTTVYLNNFVLASIYYYSFSSLFSIGYFLNERPFKNKLLNFMENINEAAVYLTSFMMFMFTDWIPDIEVRYTIGFVYLTGILGIVLINLACVLFEMGVALKHSIRNKWRIHKRKQDIMEKYKNGAQIKPKPTNS